MVVGKTWEHSELVRENVALRQEREIRQGFKGLLAKVGPWSKFLPWLAASHRPMARYY